MALVSCASHSRAYKKALLSEREFSFAASETDSSGVWAPSRKRKEGCFERAVEGLGGTSGVVVFFFSWKHLETFYLNVKDLLL